MSNEPPADKKNPAGKPESQPGKLQPRVLIPDAAPPPPKRRGKPSPLLWLGAALLVALLLAGGFVAYRMTRVTAVTFKLNAGDLRVVGEPAVIYNLMGKVDLLRSDYARRIAPINMEYTEVQNHLTAARGDLAGKVESRRLLKGEVNRLDDEIPSLISKNRSALEDLWTNQGAALDEEYADMKEKFQRKLEDRARELGVEYQRNKEIDSIDVAVNAFKLSLYGAPKTVNVEAQRKYSEEVLADWQKYQDDWQKRLLAMKEKSQAIRQQPVAKIGEVKEQLGEVQDDIRAIDSDILSFQVEIRQYETRLADMHEQTRQVTQQFVSDLLGTPKDFVKQRLHFDINGAAELADLDKRQQEFPPGEYFLWVAAEKDSEVYWAVKKFTISEHRKETVYVQRRDFVLARSYLGEEKVKKPGE